MSTTITIEQLNNRLLNTTLALCDCNSMREHGMSFNDYIAQRVATVNKTGKKITDKRAFSLINAIYEDTSDWAKYLHLDTDPVPFLDGMMLQIRLAVDIYVDKSKQKEIVINEEEDI